eukprot:80070-Amphidinium_carterae.1
MPQLFKAQLLDETHCTDYRSDLLRTLVVVCACPAGHTKNSSFQPVVGTLKKFRKSSVSNMPTIHNLLNSLIGYFEPTFVGKSTRVTRQRDGRGLGMVAVFY